METLNEFFNKSIVHEFNIPTLNDSKFELFVKRDDLIHDEFSGNKLRKLKFNIKAAREQNYRGILTFGGAYSNHLLATASACHYFGIQSIGIVRGDELIENSNKLLMRCFQLGMNLIFYSRNQYDNIKKMSGKYLFNGKEYWAVPEGGANLEGIKGCREIVSNYKFDYIITAQGTSTTSLGILLELTASQKLIVVPVLKGYNSILEMKTLLNDNDVFESLQDKVIVLDQYHFGGYAKTNDELDHFITMFNETNQFRIEPVYTGKVMFALKHWIESNKIDKNKKVLFVHTGGLF